MYKRGVKPLASHKLWNPFLSPGIGVAMTMAPSPHLPSHDFLWNSQSQASHEVTFPVLTNEGLESPHCKGVIWGNLAPSPKYLVTLAICHPCQTHYFDFAPRKNLFLHVLCVCLLKEGPSVNFLTRLSISTALCACVGSLLGISLIWFSKLFSKLF